MSDFVTRVDLEMYTLEVRRVEDASALVMTDEGSCASRRAWTMIPAPLVLGAHSNSRGSRQSHLHSLEAMAGAVNRELVVSTVRLSAEMAKIAVSRP